MPQGLVRSWFASSVGVCTALLSGARTTFSHKVRLFLSCPLPFSIEFSNFRSNRLSVFPAFQLSLRFFLCAIFFRNIFWIKCVCARCLPLGDDRRCRGIQRAAVLGHLRFGLSHPSALCGGDGGRSGTVRSTYPAGTFVPLGSDAG